MTLKRLGWLAGISTSVLAMAAPALAQSGEAAETYSEADMGNAIIVTAQRREELARDVPLSITTMSGEALVDAGVDTIRDVTLVTPGLKFDTGGAGFVIPSIRGITTNVSGAGIESNVAIYVDGVYQTSQLAATFDLPDIERLEIAKGPQGTLFGRNATGGAIQVFTRRPSLDIASGNLTVGTGSFDEIHAEGFVTVPVVQDRVGISLTGFFRKNDGYLNDIVNDRRVGKLNSKLVRGKVLFEPTYNLSLLLSGQYMDRRDDSSPFGQALDGNTIANIPGSGNIVATRPYDVSLSFPGYLRVKAEQVSLRAELETGAGTITSTTAYQHSVGELGSDTDFGVLPSADTFIRQPDESFTQELVFASEPIGPLQIVAGVFYIEHDGQFDPLISNDIVYLNSDLRSRSYALFGEATVDVTDRLTFIAGLRYSDEKIRYAGSFAFGAPAPLVQFEPVSFDAFTPRFSIRYELDPRSNIYATYSRGFKSGGLGTTNFTNAYSYRPEVVDAYEIGVKTGAIYGVDLSIAGFYYDYRDQQQLGLVQTCFGEPPNQSCAPTAVFLNAASSSIYGLEAEGRFDLGGGFTGTFGAAYLDAKYDEFPNALISRPTPGPEGGNMPLEIDASGNRLVRAPEFTISASGTYRTDLGNGELALSALIFHTSSINFDFEERVKQDPYTILNLRAEYAFGSTGFSVAAFGKNLFDEVVFQSTYINDAADGVSYAPPRTWGVSASYQF